MSNFGNKVGHLDPWYITVYKTVETGVQTPDVQFWKQSRTSGPLLIRDASQVCSLYLLFLVLIKTPVL